MPDLRQLRTFLAVAEQLSFTRAAETLHLQQQTVSKTIRRLEAELGVELLERTTREVRLTPAGEALLESGRPLVGAAEAAFARARRTGTGSLGRIRVGLSPAIGATDRQELIEALRSSESGVSVAFYDVRPAEVARRLRERELELALVRTIAADDPHLHRAGLRSTPAVICVPADHRLASRSSLELHDLDGERLLLPSPPGTPFTDMVLARFATAGVNITSVEAHISGAPSILTELRATRTLGLRPIGTELPADVVAIPIPDIELPLLLLWPAGLPSPAVHRLRQAMAQERHH